MPHAISTALRNHAFVIISTFERRLLKGDAIVAEALGLFADFIEGKVGPLPGKKCDWTSHFFSLFD